MAMFTPLHPESPAFQSRDEWQIKIRSSRKPRPSGRGVTGFTYKRKIRFQDTDAAGVIFFPNQFCFYQEAFEAFLEHIGYDLGIVTRARKHHLPVVHAEADYSTPLHLGDNIEIHLKVAHIGNSSLTFQADILKEGKIPAGGVKVVHVCVNAITLKKTPLPKSLRCKMGSFYKK